MAQMWHRTLAEGRQTAATLYTLVQSARRNCVDVWPYVPDVLRRLPAIPPTDTAALETLLPDRRVQAHPEHRLTEREGESRKAQARRRRKRAVRRAAATGQQTADGTLEGPAARCRLLPR